MLFDRENIYYNLVESELYNLVFRRVRYVQSKPQDLLDILYFSSDEKGQESVKSLKNVDISNLTDAEIEQNVQYKYKFFKGVTSVSARRENDQFDGQSIEFISNNYGAPNLALGCANLIKVKYTTPPNPNDLIAGLVVKKGNKLFYRKWFICSEQFFRAWTLLFYDDHPSYEKYFRSPYSFVNEEKLKLKVMSKNHLCTASFKKWLKESPVLTSWEIKQRFWKVRTEPDSIHYIHIYAALVLMVRFGELPRPQNVPTYKGKIQQTWDLPPKFVENIIKSLGNYEN